MTTELMKRILVISVHPDDEALGCAGTLIKCAKNGSEVYWAIITHAKAEYGFPKDFENSRNQEILEIQKKIPIKETINLGLKPAGLGEAHIPLILDALGKFVKKHSIDTVFCVNRSDAHSDHRLVFHAAAPLIKSFRYPSLKRFFSYECISETEFAPPMADNMFLPHVHIDISEVWKEKLEVVKVYASEIQEHPFPRSLKALEAQATLRGAFAGCRYAEAFQILKMCLD